MKSSVSTTAPDRAAFALRLLGGLWLLCLLAAAVSNCLWPTARCLWIQASLLSGLVYVAARAGALSFGTILAARGTERARARARDLDLDLDLEKITSLRAQARFFERVADIPRAPWERLVPAENPFVQLPYLRAVEAAGPANTRLVPALLQRDGQTIAAACFQIVELELTALGSDPARWGLPLRTFVRLVQLRHPRVRLLLCGSALHTRTGAFCPAPTLTPSEASEALVAMTRALQRREARARRPVTLTVLKDVTAPLARDALRGRGYHALTGAQPTMSLTLAPDWRTFDDYLAAMSSKYRKQARRARKRGAALTRRELDLGELERAGATLDGLLDAVMARAEFKLSVPRAALLISLKRELGARFVVTAYELEGRVVGFTAALVHGRTLEALLVGLDYDQNRAHALYHNMLYDFVAHAITTGCERAHLGRTALEIKSTVGAAPEELVSYARYPGPLMNQLLGAVAGYATPAGWTQRHPFRVHEP